MLQQTQVSRVILYYSAWMQRFPTVFDLAKSSEQEVLKCWEGLGYYSRAKALHHAANQIVERFGGKIPDNKADLLSIKGLGPYTVGAILSFGFHQKEAAVDANVVRVLTRHYTVSDDIQKPSTSKKLFALADAALPENKPWEITEAFIELGATVCQKTPLCHACPLRITCQAALTGTQSLYPVKLRRMQYETLFRQVCVVVSPDNKILIRKGQKGKACADLYEFCYFDCGPDAMDVESIEKRIFEEIGLRAKFEGYLEEEKHSFTRYRVTLFPVVLQAAVCTVPGYIWCSLDEADTLAFNSGHKRILNQLKSN